MTALLTHRICNYEKSSAHLVQAEWELDNRNDASEWTQSYNWCNWNFLVLLYNSCKQIKIDNFNVIQSFNP